MTGTPRLDVRADVDDVAVADVADVVVVVAAAVVDAVDEPREEEAGQKNVE